MKTSEQKLKVPYIERFNGNLCVTQGDFESAVMHYNKALVGLKMLFQMDKDPAITTQELAVKLIKEIEIIVCVNLAHCHNKLQNYHFAIKFATQTLEKDPNNKKALYRLGVAYTNINELERARDALNKIVEMGDDDQGLKNTAL